MLNPLNNQIDDEQERARFAKIFDQGLKKVIGLALPIERRWNGSKLIWASGPWFLRP